MTTRLLFTCAALLAASLTFPPPAAADDDEPFRIEKREFERRIRTIALTPVDAPPVVQMPDRVEAIILDEVAKRLQKEDYQVLPASVLRGIRATMEEQVGGYRNVATGLVEDMARYEAVRDHSLRELLFRHPVDAVAQIQVRVVRAEYENDRAEWDGKKQRVPHEGRGNFKGTIPASSVSVQIFDRQERLLYSHQGGLEVLMQRVDAQLVPLPPESYFQDEDDIRDAAEEALDPL